MAIASTLAGDGARSRKMTSGDRKLIIASSLGTIIEWYDFYIYLTLAAVIGPHFFGHYGEAAAELLILVSFVVGFLVRPLGALLFGRLGDLVGRKYTFLLTILIMGLSTFVVGLLPGHAVIGSAAPVLLIAARLLQGLAIGGEYGGAATFVAEHAPQGRRGFYTSFIQATATIGLMSSLVVILLTKSLMGEAAFASFGWRIPFLFSIALLGVSLFIRLQLDESPAFMRIRHDGLASKRPLKDAFGDWSNAKIVLLALFGLTMGQGVVWYAGQFYALAYMQTTLRIDAATATMLMTWAMLASLGFFILFGWLSDKIGRKPIIMFGCLAAAAAYMPIFERLTAIANPALSAALESVAVTVIADPADCGNLLNPLDTRAPSSSCDIARDLLARRSAHYTRSDGPPGEPARIVISGQELAAFDARQTRLPDEARAALDAKLAAALETAGYPGPGDPRIVKMTGPFDLFRPQVAGVIALLFALVLLVTMVYGPLAAALVELFPTRVRYTSLSLPYHIGNGWFGGVLPATAFAIAAQTGDPSSGLWYPIGVAMATFVIGVLFLPETRNRDITAGD